MSPAALPPLVIPFARFPALHQRLWEAGLTERDRYGSRPYGATLSPFTLSNARKGWGRFLATCPAAEWSAAPAGLVTPASIRRFVADLEHAGNQGGTIAARLWEVRTALRILCPGDDFRWLTSPDGSDVRSLFRSAPRHVRIYHPRLLYDWGCALMDDAGQIADPLRRAVQYRNGLLIAVLAARAPRQRSLAAIQLGVQIVRQDDRFRLMFRPSDLKGGRKTLEYDLPVGLTRRIEHYLTIERPVLLFGPDHGWFWVGYGGAPLRQRSIETIIRRQSQRHFGETFGTHRFRHAAGTLAPISDPTQPTAAAAMLDHSTAVLQKSYNLGQQEEAARRFQASLAKERQRLKGVAERAFGRKKSQPASTQISRSG